MSVANIREFLDLLKSDGSALPAGLKLNLSSKRIGDAGAKALAEALRSGQCSSGLQLDLSYNKIDTAGARALAEALRSGQCPPELTLDVRGNGLDDITLNQIHALLKMNQRRPIAMGYTAFYRGVTPLHPVLKKCLEMLLLNIFSASWHPAHRKKTYFYSGKSNIKHCLKVNH